MPRVCSHTEPPPPEGRGKKYDICLKCLRGLKPHSIVRPPASPWRLEVNGHLLMDLKKDYEDLRKMGRVLSYKNIVWLISPTGVKVAPHALPNRA